MSSLCDIISNLQQSRGQLLTPLTFEQLECIFNILRIEADEMETDFNRKSHFVTERELQCAENERLLLKLAAELKGFARNLNIIELEICENEKHLQQLNQIAMQLGLKQGSSILPANFQSDYAIILSNLESLNSQMAHSAACMELIEQFLTTEGALPNQKPITDMLTSILDLRLNALENTEKNLERLSKDCVAVEESFQLLKQKQHLFDGE